MISKKQLTDTEILEWMEGTGSTPVKGAHGWYISNYGGGPMLKSDTLRGAVIAAKEMVDYLRRGDKNT